MEWNRLSKSIWAERAVSECPIIRRLPHGFGLPNNAGATKKERRRVVAWASE
jgi:hypothetical protein